MNVFVEHTVCSIPGSKLTASVRHRNLQARAPSRAQPGAQNPAVTAPGGFPSLCLTVKALLSPATCEPQRHQAPARAVRFANTPHPSGAGDRSMGSRCERQLLLQHPLVFSCLQVPKATQQQVNSACSAHLDTAARLGTEGRARAREAWTVSDHGRPVPASSSSVAQMDS